MVKRGRCARPSGARATTTPSLPEPDDDEPITKLNHTKMRGAHVKGNVPGSTKVVHGTVMSTRHEINAPAPRIWIKIEWDNSAVEEQQARDPLFLLPSPPRRALAHPHAHPPARPPAHRSLAQAGWAAPSSRTRKTRRCASGRRRPA